MSWLFYTLLFPEEFMPVIKCVMTVLHLIVSCTKLGLCSYLQLIMPVTNVSWLFYTLLVVLLLLFAENYDYVRLCN